MAKKNLADRLAANKVRELETDNHENSVPEKKMAGHEQPVHKSLNVKPKPQKKKPDKTDNTHISIAPLEEENFSEDALLKEEQTEFDLEKHNEVKNRRFSRIIGIALGILCAYAVFLIYGVCVTTYEYQNDGTTIAKEMSVSDIKDRNDFNAILVQYESCRKLYEQVLSLDYRLSLGVEDQKLIAPEYESLLDSVEKVAVQINALVQETPTKYTQTVTLMQNWIQNDIALYLQNMSSAITLDDTEKATNALTDKENMYNDFAQITSNLASLGSVVSGVDLSTLNTWTPDGYTKSLFGE